jgi:hypothetical protein
MPLCPQITNTPITVTQTADFTVTSVIPVVADTTDGLAANFDSIETAVNGKNKIYRQTTAPTGDLTIGDIWFDTDDGNKLYYWTGTAWVSVQDNAIATAQATADSKIKTFYQASAPTASEVGDIWFDTDDGFKQYFWNGTAWTSVQDTSIAAAQSAATAAAAAATAAQTTADGKNKVFRQTSAPAASAVGDLWFDTDDDNRIYRWSGSAWVANDLGTNALANFSANKITSGTIDASVVTVSNINAGNISTGTLNADRIASASITGTKIAAATIEASNIATGTITATQIAASTITGAKIAAATITADNIAANTITASQIASATITATQIAAGTITTDKLSAGTLTGFVVQTSSGTTAVTLDGGTNSMYFKYLGTVYGHILPASSGAVMIHYGATADPVGNSYPQFYVGASAISLAQSTTRYALIDSSGLDVGGSIDATLDVTAGRDLFTPNHTTVTDAANGRVTISLGRVTRSTASSERYKENITPVRNIDELDPKKLLDLPVRAFTYREDYLSESDSRFGALIPGFIAEEVDAVYPVAADYENGEVESWNDRMIVPGLLALIQDLYKEVQILKGE